MTATVTALELRAIEEVLQMESGYVLDFTGCSFAAFFEDFGIDIGDDRYCSDGMSKAKRLRRFLRSSEPDVVASVVQGRCAEAAYGRAVAQLTRRACAPGSSGGHWSEPKTGLRYPHEYPQALPRRPRVLSSACSSQRAREDSNL